MKPFSSNPRQITKKQMERLQDKLARLGDLSGIVHNQRTDEIIGGNQRMMIFGMGQEPVIAERYETPDEQGTLAHGYITWQGKRYAYRLVDWDEQTAREANIAANLEGGDWDWDVLANAWEDLQEYGFGPDVLENWRRDVAGLDNFLKSEEPESRDAEPEIDRAEELKAKWGTELGQLWAIGEHRLFIGDSAFDVAGVSRLMDGKKAVLVHADPPYGMGKESEGIANDNLYREKLDLFQMAWWESCRPYVEDNGSAYIWGQAEDLWRLWYRNLKDSERLTIRNEITWEKQGAQGIGSDAHRMYPTSSERCLFFMLGEQGFNNNADNYWEGFEPIRSYLDGERQRMKWSNKVIADWFGFHPRMADHWFSQSQWSFPMEAQYNELQQRANGQAFKREYDELKREYDELKREFYSTRAYFDNAHENMTDVWHYERVIGDERMGHATPKPVEMMERIIKSSTPEGGLIYVPFNGTAPEMVAAQNLNRTVRAVDVDAGYCALTLERMSTAFPELDIHQIESVSES